jgi:hypothetical protein
MPRRSSRRVLRAEAGLNSALRLPQARAMPALHLRGMPPVAAGIQATKNRLVAESKSGGGQLSMSDDAC